MDKDSIENNVEHLMASAVKFFEAQVKNSSAIREKSKSCYGIILDAHMLIIGAIQSAISRHNLNPGKTSEAISNIFSLVASFIQGIDCCERAITEGYYVQAGAILKQEMETIAAIEECKVGLRNEKRTPNVKNLSWDLSRFYGDLNRVAHVADKSLLSYLVQTNQQGDAVPASVVPVFNAGEAKGLYGLHVALLVQLAIQINYLYEEVYTEGLIDVEKIGVGQAYKLLLDDGWLVTNGANFIQ
jgi:hypothetical protein